MQLHAVFVLLDGLFFANNLCVHSFRLNVKAFISNVKTALAATNPVSKKKKTPLNVKISTVYNWIRIKLLSFMSLRL